MLASTALTFLLTGALGAAAGLPPLSVYAGDPTISHVTVAPDGHAVSYLQMSGDQPSVYILPKDGGAPTRIAAGSLDLRGVEWMDSGHLALLRSAMLPASALAPQQRVIQMIAFNMSKKTYVTVLHDTRDTAPFITGGNIIYGRYEGKPSVFLRGLSRGPVFSLYAVNDDSGIGSVLRTGSFDAEDWAVAPNGDVLAEKVLLPMQKRSALLMQSGAFAGAVPLPDPAAPFDLAGLGRSGADLLVSQGDDLFEVSPTGAASPPLQPAGRKVSGRFSDRETGRLVAIQLQGREPNIIFYDAALEAAWKMARSAFQGKELRLIAFDDSRKELVVRTESADDPGSIYWLHVGGHRAELVGQERPALDKVLAPVSFIPFSAPNGDAWTAVVTTPPGKPLHDLPAVALTGLSSSRPGHVHLEIFAQALASRGYAVVELAASGRDKNAVPADDEEVDGATASDDADPGGLNQSALAQAVAALADHGAIDRKRACVSGVGFGGYIALRSVMGPNDIYRCVIAIQPVVDLTTLIRYPDLYTRSSGYDTAAAWRKRLGQVTLQPKSLQALSPVYHADRIRAPVLLVHEQVSADTDRDPERMKDALQRAAKPVTLVKLDPSTQDLGTAAGTEKMLSAMLDFLAIANPAT